MVSLQQALSLLSGLRVGFSCWGGSSDHLYEHTLQYGARNAPQDSECRAGVPCVLGGSRGFRGEPAKLADKVVPRLCSSSCSSSFSADSVERRQRIQATTMQAVNGKIKNAITFAFDSHIFPLVKSQSLSRPWCRAPAPVAAPRSMPTWALVTRPYVHVFVKCLYVMTTFHVQHRKDTETTTHMRSEEVICRQDG